MNSHLSFSLVDQPWLPCVVTDLSGGHGLQLLSLREVITRAPTIAELLGDTPLETVALHRLLLALLHRSLRGPKDAVAWGAWRDRGVFGDAVVEYLDTWRHAFDLFDPERPFFQTPGLDPEKAGSVARLQYQADNNPTLFDHSVSASPPWVPADKAARLVVALHAFDTGGTKTSDHGQASARAAPLVQAAVAQVRGRTLFETLLLNLCRYEPRRAAAPWDFDPEADRPAWEREAPRIAGERYPDGYCDLLTWQPRRIWLEPSVGGSGRLGAQRVVIMNGTEWPRDFERRGREPMLAFRQRRKPIEGESPWYPLRFDEDRALWRDSLTLFTSASSDASRPRLMDWLAELTHIEGLLPETAVLPLDLAGLAVERAKCLFWRHERLTIPAAIIARPELADPLRHALDVAERAARIIAGPFTRLPPDDRAAPSALRIVAAGLGRQDRDVNQVLHQLDTGRIFWARLETPFHRFLNDLPADETADEAGNPRYGDQAFQTWAREVDGALLAAFAAIRSRAGYSPAALAAVARGERAFAYQRRAVLAMIAPTSTEHEVVS